MSSNILLDRNGYESNKLSAKVMLVTISLIILVYIFYIK